MQHLLPESCFCFLGVGSKEPVNYALRKAAADLTQFDDFDEVSSRFFDNALDMFQEAVKACTASSVSNPLALPSGE